MRITREFEYNGAKVTVHNQTVRAKLQSELLYTKFGTTENTPEGEWYELFQFVRLLTQTTVDGDIGFAIPEISAPVDELRAGLEAFMNCDSNLITLLNLAWQEVSTAPNKPELLPSDEVPKKKEKSTAKSEKIS